MEKYNFNTSVNSYIILVDILTYLFILSLNVFTTNHKRIEDYMFREAV